MCFYDSTAFPGPSIFDAPTDDPQMAVRIALDGLADAASRYTATGDVLDGILLLNEIEGLRRFVLVRRTLAVALARPDETRHADRPQIVRGAAPDDRRCAELVASCTRPGNHNMERDTRRAIACLNFLGSLDTRFL